MPSVRRIAPLDSLEFGFRAAYSQTVDAIIDATGCIITDEGVLQFYNDLDELLGEIDLSSIFKLKNEVDPANGGLPVDYPSATEEDEGFVKLATVEEALSGVDEFKAITPAVLAFILDKFGLNPVLNDLKNILNNGNVGEDNIILKGPFNYYNRRTTQAFSGFVVQRPDGSQLGTIGFEYDDSQVTTINGQVLEQLTPEVKRINTPALNAQGSRTVVQTLATKVLQIAANYDSVAVFELDASSGEYRLKVVPRSVHSQDVINDLNLSQLASRLAPLLNNKTVDGDARIVESPIHCFTETAQLNQQFIPITYSMLGADQPHNLNVDGSGIFRSLQDSTGQPTPYIAITFPNANHYRLTLGDSGDIDSAWTGELALIKKTQAAVVNGGGTRYVVTVTRLLSELPAAASLGHPSGKKLYLVPVGLAPPAVGSLVTPIGNGWQDYTGPWSALGTGCADVPPPTQAGDPTWVTTISPAAPTLTKGTYYTWSFPMAANTDPGGAGLTVVVTTGSYFGYLNADYPDADTFRLSGTIPESFSGTSISLTLRAQQSDGRYADKQANITISNPSSVAALVWNTPLSPTPIVPGQPGWFWRIPNDAVTVPGGYSFAVSISGGSHPWINMIYDGNYKLYGNPPSTLTGPVLISLTAVQSIGGYADPRSVDTVATIPLVSAQVPLILAVQQLVSSNGTRTMILRGGADFGNLTSTNPYETTTGPAGFVSRGKQQMRRWGTNVLSVEYTYDNDPGYTNAPLGTYYVTYEATDGRKKYASYVLGGGTMNQALSLSDTPPVVAPVDIAVLNVDYSYQHNSPPGIQTNLYVFVKTNGGAGSVTMAIEGVGPTSDYILPKSSYSAFASGDFGSGYNLRISIAGIAPGAVEKLYIKPSVGSEIVLTITLPGSGDTNRNPIYPAGPAPVITHTLYESLY